MGKLYVPLLYSNKMVLFDVWLCPICEEIEKEKR